MLIHTELFYAQNSPKNIQIVQSKAEFNLRESNLKFFCPVRLLCIRRGSIYTNLSKFVWSIIQRKMSCFLFVLVLFLHVYNVSCVKHKSNEPIQKVATQNGLTCAGPYCLPAGASFFLHIRLEWGSNYLTSLVV
jgi:hypothetical protein